MYVGFSTVFAIISVIFRLGYSAPHAVVFQAVAGASSSMLVAGDDDVIDASEKDDDDNSNKVCYLLSLYVSSTTLLRSLIQGTLSDVRRLSIVSCSFGRAVSETSKGCARVCE